MGGINEWDIDGFKSWYSRITRDRNKLGIFLDDDLRNKVV